ncbi:MAG: DUF1015 domain-containing protein [Oligoflexia bacterium]|nr:DUF1015 domain-containing protein [Oligoflexia bacterium]
MSTIRAFRAIRPKKEFAAKVASRPYDVINSEEARTEAGGNPYSFLHVVKSEIDLPEDTDIHDDLVYQKARQNLDKFISDGILFREEKPMLYIYSQTMNGRTQYGLVGCASVGEYENNIIRKHEFTRKDKEDDRCRHVETCNANTGPVFLTYRDNDSVNDTVSNWVKNNAPEYSFTADDSVRHEVWVINCSETINEITGAFKKVPLLYVADGHHRSASAARVGRIKRDANKSHTGSEEYNFYLAVFFPASHLMIMDYNRIVTDLNGMPKEAFLNAVSEKFEIMKNGISKPSQPKTFGMYMDGEWIQLKVKKGTYPEDDPVNSLDVAILQNNLLGPLLGIGDPRTDNRIDFVGGIRGMKELEHRVNSGKYKIAFSTYPVSLKELMNVSDAGMTMPPKSTWFEPKLRSGLLIHSLE